MLSVAPGGFVGSLALYDSTGFCDDPSLSIFGVAGKYALALSVQPNDRPMFLVDNYNLLAGANYGSVVFVAPGDITGQTLRSGNWNLQEDLDGGTAVPEPTSLLLSAVGLSALIAILRKK